MTSLILCLKSSGSFIINWVMQTFSTKVFTSILLILMLESWFPVKVTRLQFSLLSISNT